MFAVRRVLLFAALAVLSLALVPAWAAGSPVWEVRGEGSFLIGGTIHMLRPRDFPLPAVFDRAYDVTDTVVLETDLGALVEPDIQRLIMERGFQRGGRTLADDLRPDTWQRLTELAEELDIGISMLEGMRPAFAGLTLARAMLARLGVTEVGTDGYFYRRARADGRPLQGLESAREQILLLLSLGDDDPDRFLDANLEDLQRASELINEAIHAWRRGDFEALNERLIEPSRREDPISYRRLFVERNAAWMPKLEAFADSQQREFVLVGAGHLGGDDGLLHALREAGYEVQPWRMDDLQGGRVEQ
ncbi:MAG: TraB/GumN family protein [Gammaproteobacteria bacterium]|nr:TraB/GumN family protein [Gammaproteobacteria bacterium]